MWVFCFCLFFEGESDKVFLEALLYQFLGFHSHGILQKPLPTDGFQAALCIHFPHVQEFINRSNIRNDIVAYFLRVFIHLLSLELEEAPRT